jgi:acyl carrier protein
MKSTWTEEQITAEIKRIVKETFDIDLSEQDGSVKIADTGLDSMGILDIVMSLEDLTGKKLVNLEFPKNPTLADVASLVVKNLQE